MEGVLLKSESHNESWQERKAEAGPEAARRIASIEGYKDLDLRGRIEKLEELFHTLEANNDNRFVAEIVSLTQARLEREADIAQLEKEAASIQTALAQ